MTAAEPRQRHPAAGPQTEAADRLIGVGRAGGQMAAIEPDQCRNAMAVKLDQPARGKRRAARKVAQKRTRALSQPHPRFHRATASATLSLYPPQDNCGSPAVMAAAPKFGGLGHAWG